MAVEIPRRSRQLPATTATAFASYTARTLPVIDTATGDPLPSFMMRALQALPGVIAIVLIGTLLSGYALFPTQLAIALLAFDVFWLWKSWTVMVHAVKGYRMIRENETKDWRAEYDAASFLRAVPWEDVRHIVIIPNYKESPEKLHATLTAMAEADGARDCLIPVLAMEEAEPDSQAKGDLLLTEFKHRFADMFVTSHPVGLVGEIRGKSSNQAWAVRRVVEELVDHRGMDIDTMTVTSCDADTIFPKAYFSALTYNFATNPRRYRLFWQAPIFFYNNIWQVPAPLRVPNALAGLVHLSRLSRKRKVLFSQSTYTLSMRMAHDVGYWDADIIPEDWHMFLKCYYHFSGNVEVQPIHLMLGNDGALSRTPKETAINHYLQVRRWAWGASDVPYVFNQAAMHPEMSLGKRWLRCWYVLDNHVLWSTQWFYITLGGFIPVLLGRTFGIDVMPDWFPMIARIILTPCLAFYIILIILDHKLRPAPPTSVTPYIRVTSMVHWILLPVVSFFASCLPALDSQIRLVLNRRMEYRVTEKI